MRKTATQFWMCYPALEKRVADFIDEHDAFYHGEAVEIIEQLRDALDNELKDVQMISHIASVVYDHVTGGMVSKCNTDADVIKALHDDHVNDLVNEAVKEAIEAEER